MTGSRRSTEAQEDPGSVVLRRLRQVITSTAPGSHLPAMRALAQRLGTSTFTLHKAMGTLAEEGLVIRRARSGIQVRQSDALVFIVEHLPHQRAFWEVIAAAFRCSHPGNGVELRFLRGPDELRRAAAARDGRPALAVSVTHDALGVATVPLRELFAPAELERLRTSILPILRPALDGVALPYQLQPQAWLMPLDRQPEQPAWTTAEALAWLQRQGRKPWAPPALFSLLEQHGLHPRSVQALRENGRARIIRLRLTAMTDFALQLANTCGPAHAGTGCDAGDGTLAAVVKTGHLWGQHGLRRGGRVALQPSPCNAEGTRQINPIYAAQIGSVPDRACAALLVWLLDPATQRMFVEHCYGLPVDEQALDCPPDQAPPGFARMVAAVRAAGAVLPLDEASGLKAVGEAVLDRVLVPALLGLPPEAVVLDELATLYMRACLASDDRAAHLRRILLAG